MDIRVNEVPATRNRVAVPTHYEGGITAAVIDTLERLCRYRIHDLSDHLIPVARGNAEHTGGSS